MEIRVHTLDGECHRFRAGSQEDAIRILKPVTPVKLFDQPQFIVKGASMMMGFAASLVEEVEFITDIDIGWVHPNGMPRIEKVGEQRYLDHLAMVREQGAEAVSPADGGKSAAVGLFTMRSGRRIYLEYDVMLRSAVDQRHAIHGILKTGGFYVRAEGGGHSVINAANVLSFLFHPGPAQGPLNSWRAEAAE